MKSYRFSWVGIAFFVILIVFMITLGYKKVESSSYPDMWSRYAGFVKPIRNLVDYTGTCLYSTNFSTCYLGAYVSSATYDTRVNANEGGGSHYGVDITAGSICNQTEVRSVAAGEIYAVVSNWLITNPGATACGNNYRDGFRGWGNYVIVRHDDVPGREGYGGTSFSVYAHLASVGSDIQVGRKVLRGSYLGTLGSTGASSGPHLHFQIDKNFSDVARPYAASYCDPAVPQGAPNFLNCTIDTVANQQAVRNHTFNPLQYAQEHIVSTTFSQGACTQYFNGNLGPEPINYNQCAGYDFENEIDHEWLTGGPVGYQTDNFSARWIGDISIPSGKSWIFYITDDDIAKVWIDNQVIMDDWSVNNPSIPETWVAFIPNLNPGMHKVKVEYKEVPSSVPGSDNATMQLAWQPAWLWNLPIVLKQPTPTFAPSPTPTRTPTPNPAFQICEPNETVAQWGSTSTNNCSISTNTSYYYLYPANGASTDADVFRYGYYLSSSNPSVTITFYLESIPSGFPYRFEVFNAAGQWLGISQILIDGTQIVSVTPEKTNQYNYYFVRIYSENEYMGPPGYSSTDTYQIRAEVAIGYGANSAYPAP